MINNMKSHFKIIVFTMLLLFIHTACIDNRMHNMVDDSVYVLKPSYNQVEVFNWEGFAYSFEVIKSGVGQQSSDVKLVVDESYLTNYNLENGTAYKLLPENLYSIKTTQMSLSAKDYRALFPIEFDANGIIELQGEGNAEYIIPIKVEVANESIAAEEDRLFSLVAPVVHQPYLQFKDPGLAINVHALIPLSPDVSQFATKVITTYNNKWDLDFEIVVDAQALDTYNSENGTSYKLLPEAAYKLLSETSIIKKNLNEGSFQYEILKQGLVDGDTNLFGEYLLPLRITSVSQNKINPDADLFLIRVSFLPENLEREGWEVIECSSEQPGEGGGASAVLDGDTETYWLNQWEDYGQGVPELPHHIIIDMKKEYDLMALEVLRRKNWETGAANTATRKVVFEISSDNTSYEYATTIDFGPVENNALSMNSNMKTMRGRYLKCIVTESNVPPHISIAEIYVKGSEIE